MSESVKSNKFISDKIIELSKEMKDKKENSFVQFANPIIIKILDENENKNITEEKLNSFIDLSRIEIILNGSNKITKINDNNEEEKKINNNTINDLTKKRAELDKKMVNKNILEEKKDYPIKLKH